MVQPDLTQTHHPWAPKSHHKILELQGLSCGELRSPKYCSPPSASLLPGGDNPILEHPTALQCQQALLLLVALTAFWYDPGGSGYRSCPRLGDVLPLGQLLPHEKAPSADRIIPCPPQSSQMPPDSLQTTQPQGDLALRPKIQDKFVAICRFSFPAMRKRMHQCESSWRIDRIQGKFRWNRPTL